MLMPNRINPFVPAQDLSFDLYTDEVQVLYDAAVKSGKTELVKVMKWLLAYSKQKTSRNNGPMRFTFK